MAAKNIKFGMGGVFMPPVELNAQAVQRYEKSGIDFVAYWDQLCMTFPRSIWTPDIVPAAATYDIDCYMDAFALATQAAMVTEKIGIGIVATDCLRRPPSVLAQSFLTIDHIAKGRAFFCLGAGEIKQFAPHGLPRDKPFAHMEEAIKIIRMLAESKVPVTYDGPIWKLKNAILAFQQLNPHLIALTLQKRGHRCAGGADFNEDIQSRFRNFCQSAITQPVDVAQDQRFCGQKRAWADNHLCFCRIKAQHIERFAAGNAEPATLADGIVNNALMLAQNLSADMNDLARLHGFRLQPFDDFCIFSAGHKTNILTVGFVGYGKAELPGELTHFRLGHVAQRKAQEFELFGCGGKEEIALVAVRVSGAVERARAIMGAAGDIMAGGQNIRAQFKRGFKQIVEFNVLVAGHARNWCFAPRIAQGKIIDHLGTKAGFIIQNIMRNTEPFGHHLRVVNILTGAAGPFAVNGGAMIIELQGNAEHIITLCVQQGGNHAGVDAAGHSHHHARVFRGFGQTETVEAMRVEAMVVV